MEGDNQLPACVLCGTSAPGKKVSPVEPDTQVKFLQQVQTFSSSCSSFLGLSVTPLCEDCVCDISLATENGEEMAQGETQVRRLQQVLLSSLRDLCKKVDKYLEGMRRLEEHVRRAESHDFGSDSENENAGWLRGAVIHVVRELRVTRESISARTTLPEQTEEIAYEDEDIFLPEDDNVADAIPVDLGDNEEVQHSSEMEDPTPQPLPPAAANSIVLEGNVFAPNLEVLSKIKNAKKKRAAYKEQLEKWRSQTLKCPLCDIFLPRRHLRSHLSNSHQLNVFEPRKSAPTGKLWQPQGEYIHCEYCHQKLRKDQKSQLLWEVHQLKVKKRKTKGPQEACSVCGKLLTVHSLRVHMRGVHGITVTERREGVTSNCDLCHTKTRPSQLAEHLEGHVGAEYVIRCPNTANNCRYACATSYRMKRHWENSPTCPKAAQINVDLWRKDQNTCPVCGTLCTNLQSLRGHLLRFHETADKPFVCPVSRCELRFTLRESVVLHLTQHDFLPKSKTQSCVHCKEAVPLKKMGDHLKGKHGAEEIIKCTHCPFQFDVREHLVDHLYSHRHSKLYCDICGSRETGTFTLHAHLAAHYFTEHGIGREWRCEECPNKVFFGQFSLRGHRKQQHNPKTQSPAKKKMKEWKCEDCGEVRKTEASFRTHKIRKHGGEPFGCRFCAETFTDLYEVLHHENYVHQGVKKQVYFPCTEPECGAVLKTRRTLDVHVKKVHLGEKGEHVCGECEKAYWSAVELKKHHEKVHLGIRKYKCDVCGKAFASSHNLKNHCRIHSEERPFACDLCGQRFRQQTVLYGHMQGHQRKGDKFKPTGPMKRVKRISNNETSTSASRVTSTNDTE